MTALLHYHDYDSRLAAYAVIVDDRDRVLLALWNEAEEPQWTMPGGAVELHETIQDAVLREVAEESGYEIELGRLLGVDTMEIAPAQRARAADRGRWLRGIRVVFEATVTGGRLRPEVDGTTDEARWIPLAEVPDLPRVDLVDVALGMRAAAD